MRLYRESPNDEISRATDSEVPGEIFVEGWMVEVEVVEIPWCAEHYEQLDPIDGKCFYAFAMRHKGETSCRLEEPARHLRIEET